MTRSIFLVSSMLLASSALTGCASILGIDDRAAGGGGAAGSSGASGTGGTTPTSDASVDANTPRDAGPDQSVPPTDSGVGGDASVDVLDAADAGAPDVVVPVYKVCPAGDGGAGDAMAVDGGVVVDVTIDAKNCGACGNACGTTLAKSVACVSSKCVYTCEAGLAHCGVSDATGCDTDISVSPNCGGCGITCGTKFASSSTCQPAGDAGTFGCKIVCQPGHTHCSSDPKDGCDTATASDATSCGKCGYSCGAYPCSGGLCLLDSSHPPLYEQVVMDATDLYWPIQNDKVVYAISKTLGPTSLRTMTTPVTNKLDPAIAVDATHVYFNNEQLYKVLKTATGSAPTPLVTAGIRSTTGFGIFFIEAVADRVYVGTTSFSDKTYCYWANVPKTGAAAVSWGSTQNCVQLATSPTNDQVLFWEGALDWVTQQSAMLVHDFGASGGGADVVLGAYNQQASSGSVATDGRYAYWATYGDGNKLHQVDLNDPGTVRHRSIASFDRSTVPPKGALLVDGASLYYIGDDWSIHKIDTAAFETAPDTVLAPFSYVTTALIGVDATDIYFYQTWGGTGYGIFRTAK